MPYKRIEELPDSVKNSLPEEGQHIFKKAFNSAWDQYKDKSGSKGNDSREETAHRIAWSAVKKKYQKKDTKWIKKS